MDTREKAEKLLEWAKKVPDDELLWTHLDILEVAQAYLNPWISVEKELPEEGQQVLLFIVYQRMIGGIHCEDEIIISGGRKDGDWFVGNDMMLWDYSFNLDFTDDDVTHWMTPNPPKE